MKLLEDQIAVVTGGGSGIGEATAIKLADAGARVFVADIEEKAAKRVAEAISNGNGNSTHFAVDVSNEQQVRLMLDEVLTRWGRIDILINNAGIGIAAKIADTSLDDWKRVMDVNVTGTFLCCKHAIPVMVKQGGGTIVNTASVAGVVGLPDRAVYTASKFAVVGITKSIAADYAEFNIRCNAVCPGTIETPWIGKILSSAPDKVSRRKQMEQRQLIKRLGAPEEIADAILFLSSPQATFVHGSALVVDGGITAV